MRISERGASAFLTYSHGMRISFCTLNGSYRMPLIILATVIVQNGVLSDQLI